MLPPLGGLTAILVAHTLTRAAECRKASVGWKWPGRWSSQDWKDSCRSEVALSRRLRLADFVAKDLQETSECCHF